jgi:excisionase family DNA binding protein
MQNTASNDSDSLIRIKDVAAALNVHRTTVQGWIRVGAIPFIPLPRGGYRIKRSTLEELMQLYQR